VGRTLPSDAFDFDFDLDADVDFDSDRKGTASAVPIPPCHPEEAESHAKRATPVIGPDRVERTLLSAAFDLDLDFAGCTHGPLQDRGRAALQRRVKRSHKNTASAARAGTGESAREGEDEDTGGAPGTELTIPARIRH